MQARAVTLTTPRWASGIGTAVSPIQVGRRGDGDQRLRGVFINRK